MMAKIAIIYGAPSKGSRLYGLVKTAVEVLTAAGHVTEIVAVTDLPGEELLAARFEHPAIQDANVLVEDADGIVIASPVYKASYSGILKAYLDLLPQKAFADKVVLPLFIGGSIAHLLAIDYGLKPVLAALGARFVQAGVYAVDSHVRWNEFGGVDLSEEVSHRLDAALRQFSEDLSWFASRTQAAMHG